MTRRITEAQRARTHARYERLKEMSVAVELAMQMGQLECNTINEGLKILYARQGHTDLRTFREWKDAGYSVNTGAESCPVWSKPYRKEKRVNAAKNGQEGNADETGTQTDNGKTATRTYETFRMCHLYGRDQVHETEQQIA